MGNLSSGRDHVTTTVALTIQSLLMNFKTEMTGLKMVYDEGDSFETAVKSFRRNNNLEEENSELYPLFAFRRSVLRYAAEGGPGRRANSIFAKQLSQQNVAGKGKLYRIVHGEFDIDFTYYTKNTPDLEKFEILYMGEEGLSSKKELEVDLTSELGLKLTYFANYDVLSDKAFQTDDMVYKALTGRLTIRGFYPIWRSDAKVILNVNVKLQSFLKEVFGNINITA